MSGPTRAYKFTGSDDAYIRFLEANLGQAQKALECLTYPIGASTGGISASTGGFEIIVERPEIAGSRPCKGSRSLGAARWKVELDNFLASISTQLASQKQAVGRNDNRTVLDTLLLVSFQPASSDHGNDPSPGPSAISSLTCSARATRYAQTTCSMLSQAESALTSARFRGIVVAALSEVLQAHNPNLGWGDSTLRECFGDVGSLRCRRLRRGAAFAWKCMSWLERTPWKHRGSEIIYLSESAVLFSPVIGLTNLQRLSIYMAISMDCRIQGKSRCLSAVLCATGMPGKRGAS